MKKLHLLFILLLCLIVSVAVAQDKNIKKEKPKEVTITGRITDVKCHLNGMAEDMGEDHKQCAIDCIKSGLPVGILEDNTDKLYIIVPSKGMKSANEELLKHADQKVKLTGKMLERSGVKMFAYTKVEETK